MVHLVFHHDYTQLPRGDDSVIPVQIYSCKGRSKREDVFSVGSPLLQPIRKLGVRVPVQSMDFLSIALAVTAADTFVQRSHSPDGWTRQLLIELPLLEAERWIPLTQQLEEALHFLSGDIWQFKFSRGGFPPPFPSPRGRLLNRWRLRSRDCACLFSGGLDSAIGVIDLLTDKRSPLLVSHSYRGDKTYQSKIADSLKGRYSQFSANAYPMTSRAAHGETEITMRTRSINFLAFGSLVACSIGIIKKQEKVDLLVPENGFISLNAPLTPRRIGTLSTRTTHPHFIDSIQAIFDAAEIACNIKNPYQFLTKGEMVAGCKNKTLLASIIDNTVSCSHWKRNNQQCGVCVPCIIRRSALFAGELNEQVDYSHNCVTDVMSDPDKRDDLFALCIAIAQRPSKNVGAWILGSGPLSPNQLQEFKGVFSRGLDEVESYLKAENVL